jgi:hypothetical protein
MSGGRSGGRPGPPEPRRSLVPSSFYYVLTAQSPLEQVEEGFLSCFYGSDEAYEKTSSELGSWSSFFLPSLLGKRL